LLSKTDFPGNHRFSMASTAHKLVRPVCVPAGPGWSQGCREWAPRAMGSCSPEVLIVNSESCQPAGAQFSRDTGQPVGRPEGSMRPREEAGDIQLIHSCAPSVPGPSSTPTNTPTCLQGQVGRCGAGMGHRCGHDTEPRWEAAGGCQTLASVRVPSVACWRPHQQVPCWSWLPPTWNPPAAFHLHNSLLCPVAPILVPKGVSWILLCSRLLLG
jgi:hypothetical protein